MTSPARTTRKEAMARGGRKSSPILAAIKLNAQTITRMAIDAAMMTRFGVRPLGDSIFTGSNQSLFANGQLFDQVESRLEPDSGACWDANRSLGRNRDLRR